MPFEDTIRNSRGPAAYQAAPRFREVTDETGEELLDSDTDHSGFAIAKCNGPEYRTDRFPEQNEGGPAINPCDDLPDEHLKFFFDPKYRVATVSYTTERGRVSIDLFVLNRPDLRGHRSKMIENLFVLSRIAETNPDAMALFAQSLNEEEEYAAFARELARQAT